jgi:excinuclease UvrABC helicase subunit UvrB
MDDDPEVMLTAEQRDSLIAEMETKMREAAKAFEFEKAAQFRDRMKALKASSLYEEATPTRFGGGG